MSLVTTHVLDTALGRPAAGVPVRLERPDESGAEPHLLGEATTDADGRVGELGPDALEAGTYRLVLDVESYAAATGQSCFFPEVVITFALTDPTTHHHVPLLLSPYGYSTYRGS